MPSWTVVHVPFANLFITKSSPNRRRLFRRALAARSHLCIRTVDVPYFQYSPNSAMAKRGLYANINAKRKAGKKPRKKGAKGAPTDQDFKNAAKTAKKKKK